MKIKLVDNKEYDNASVSERKSKTEKNYLVIELTGNYNLEDLNKEFYSDNLKTITLIDEDLFTNTLYDYTVINNISINYNKESLSKSIAIIELEREARVIIE